jgi:hypothetical protein
MSTLILSGIIQTKESLSWIDLECYLLEYVVHDAFIHVCQKHRSIKQVALTRAIIISMRLNSQLVISSIVLHNYISYKSHHCSSQYVQSIIESNNSEAIQNELNVVSSKYAHVFTWLNSRKPEMTVVGKYRIILTMRKRN